MDRKNKCSCAICGKESTYVLFMGFVESKEFALYEFGKYKPQRIWYCRTHTNAEIEKKIKELDF